MISLKAPPAEAKGKGGDFYEGVAVAKMTDMHLHLLSLKRYWDMTGNNINHPNDFLARVYAQVVAQMLVEEL